VVVEEQSMTSPLEAVRDPFPASGLDALLAQAARDCPDAVLLRDDSGASSAADLARRAGRLSGLLRLAGLEPGERVLIVAGAQVAAFVALVACLRAGLEPALIPCGSGPVEIAACTRVANAVALIGPARYGGLELDEIYLSAAAIADSIRLIATQGPNAVDGALDVSFAQLDAMDVKDAPAPDGREQPMIATFQGPASAPTLVCHRQATLLADALSLVEQAHINPTTRIISTVPPATLAGLVGGPFAALVGASGLVLHGPFDARRFLALCDVEPGYHVVAPAAGGASFSQALGVGTTSPGMTSLVLISRFADAEAFDLPAPLDGERPVVDLYAFGEETILAQRRIDGRARPPARVPDKSLAGGLGAKLNRARAEHMLQGEGA
jgi:acyl-CoA synthetase (AMP-forming)/AMP-acid ligase II